MRQTIAAAVLWASLAGLSMASDADAAVRKQTNIQAQSLAPALQILAKEYGFQVVYRSDVVAAVQTRGASGELTAAEALSQLLRDTGLSYAYLDDKAVTIVRSSQAPARQSAAGEGVFRLAHSEGDDPSPAKTQDSISESDRSATAQPELDKSEIVVTGTHIRGVEKAGSNVIVLDRKYIEETGYSRIEDVIKSLPQAGPGTSATNNFAKGTLGNYGGGYSVDLRGLGDGTTLVLVDGMRQASSGTAGMFVDLSSIPLAAVERIEVLLDGGSATYGSDAVGGVVNVITRKDYRGFETRVRVGNYSGDTGELNISQLIGAAWGTGSATLGYELRKTDAMPATDRDFSADSDQRANGGGNYSTDYSNPGNIVSPAVYAIPRNQNGIGLTSGQLLAGQVNYVNSNANVDLMSRQDTQSFFLNGSQRLGSRLELYATGRYTRRPCDSRSDTGRVSFVTVRNTNPYFVPLPAPYGSNVSYFMNYSLARDHEFRTTGDTRTKAGGLGARLELSPTWRLNASGTYAQESLDYRSEGYNSSRLNEVLGNYNNPATPGRDIDDPATAYNPFVDGFLNPYADGPSLTPAMLDFIRTYTPVAYESKTLDSTLQADGRLATLPGGELRLALGANYRKEELITGQIGFNATLAERIPVERDVKALFAELAIPLIGAGNRLPGVRSLTASVAARFERYNDFGDATNPQLGLTWRPAEALKVRASWGTSFRAPSLTQMNFTYNSLAGFPLSMSDPQSPAGSTQVLWIEGGNPDLKEERSKQWTVGLDFQPERLPGLHASATYHAITYRDRIASGGTPGQELLVLEQEDIWSSIITRNPTAEQLAAVCTLPRVFCSDPPPDAIVDFRLRNLSRTKEDGLDLEVGRDFQTNRGLFSIGLTGALTFSNERYAAAGSPGIDIVDTAGNILSKRLGLTARWSQRNVMARARLNYSPSYDDPTGGLTGVPRPVTSWTTLDLQAKYALDSSRELLRGIEFRASVNNVFDKDPPYVDTVLGYDGANANPYGRYMSIEVAKSW